MSFYVREISNVLAEKGKRKRRKMNEESSDNLNFEIVIAEEFYTSWVCLDGSRIR